MEDKVEAENNELSESQSGKPRVCNGGDFGCVLFLFFLSSKARHFLFALTRLVPEQLLLATVNLPHHSPQR